MMRRREFFMLVGGAAAAWPLTTRAQQPALPVVGLMVAGSRGPLRQPIAAFHEGLKESGYTVGQNVAIEYRFAEGSFDRFPTLASGSVRRQVDVLVVSSNAGALAAKQATTTIPIVFSVGDDPINTGLVDSLNRPAEDNITGVYQFTVGLEAKRLRAIARNGAQGHEHRGACPPELLARRSPVARRAGSGAPPGRATACPARQFGK